MRARASKGPVPNADDAAGTTHSAAGHGTPPGVPRAFGRWTHRTGGLMRDDTPGGATATAELRARRGAARRRRERGVRGVGRHGEWRGGGGGAGAGRAASDTPHVAILEAIITTNNR